MKSCIYYDLEEILPEDVQRARSFAPGAKEFIARGAHWPEHLDGHPPAELCNPREIEYQQRLMSWIDELFAELEQSRARSVVFRQNGISLLEISRYRFLAEFAETEQRLSAASDIFREGAERICWIAPRRECPALRQLTSGMTLPRFEIVDVPRPRRESNRLWRLARSLGRNVVDRMVNGKEAIARRPPAQFIGRGASVAIVEYYPNSAKVLIPVAAALREQYGVETVWIAARRAVKDLLAQHGIGSILLRHLTPNTNRAHTHLAPEANRVLRDAIGSLSDKIFFGTGSLFGKSLLLSAMTEKLSSLAEESAFWLDSFAEMFATLRPLGVVSTTYSSTVGRAVALAARERNVLSAFVQHGKLTDHDAFSHFCNDVLFVWGQANKRAIVRSGVAEARVKVVGASIYDELIRCVQTAGPAEFPRPGSPLNIAYMASRTAGQIVSFSMARLHMLTIARAVSQIPNARLTVKLHPADHTRMIETVLKDYPNVRMIREGVAQDAILEADAVIVASSTTGLEACVADKPLIVVETNGLTDCGLYREYEAALYVSVDRLEDSTRLADAIRQLASDPSILVGLAEGRRRLIDDVLNGGKGDAADLTAIAINELLNGAFNPIQSANTARLPAQLANRQNNGNG